MSRLNEFFELLLRIYGGDVVDNLFERNTSDNLISYKQDKIGLTRFIISYFLDLKKKDQSQIKSCDKCESIFKKYFKNRPFEISNWRGNLDFNRKNIKDIMIVGEAAGPGIKSHLNYSYGLCNLPIEYNGVINWEHVEELYKNIEDTIKKEKKYNWNYVEAEITKIFTKRSINHKLYEYLYEIFAEPYQNLEKLLNSLYITDMVRCNLSEKPGWKSNSIWRKCIDNCKDYFFEEIRLIIPKLILITADSTYETFTSLLEGDNITINFLETSEYLKNFPSRKFGYFLLGGNKIYFYQIYHNKKYYQLEKKEVRPTYKKQNSSLFSKEIMTKILRWN